MTLTLSAIEDVEATLRTLLEACSWMDWWLMVAHSMVIPSGLNKSVSLSFPGQKQNNYDDVKCSFSLGVLTVI